MVQDKSISIEVKSSFKKEMGSATSLTRGWHSQYIEFPRPVFLPYPPTR